MFDDLLTEAARRTIDAASIIAAHNSALEREPLHLLWALMLDESHASEALARAGVTRERLRSVSPFDVNEESVSRAKRASPDTPASAEFGRILAIAAQSASLRGRQAQIGTDDLLAALLSVESEASQILFDLGVRSENLAGDSPSAEQATDPLSIDFNIRWRDATAEHQTETLRIVDAAANRAREGLRVLEDYARFALDDAYLTSRLKECRHALREVLSQLPAAGLLRSRETERDVGTRITTQAEKIRQSPLDVARAAFKRTQEAVRSLEEFGKLWSTTAAGRLERLRYSLYTLEKAFLLTEANRRQLAERRLYLLLTESLCRHGSGPAVRGALAGGVDIVQVREKEMSDRALIEHGRNVRRWTREAGALYLMNDRADLAVVTDADGVHVGQDELSVKEARTIVGPHRLVGVSTHTIAQARQAVLDGADYIGVGPVFPSSTKSFDALAGLEFVRAVAAELTIPWFAIGGIGSENVGSVLEAGARRIAVSQAILSAEDPETATRAFCARIAAVAQAGRS